MTLSPFVGPTFEVLFLRCLSSAGKIEGIELNLNLSCNDMKEMNQIIVRPSLSPS